MVEVVNTLRLSSRAELLPDGVERPTRLEVVVTFLVILELICWRVVTVEQRSVGAEIRIYADRRWMPVELEEANSSECLLFVGNEPPREPPDGYHEVDRRCSWRTTHSRGPEGRSQLVEVAGADDDAAEVPPLHGAPLEPQPTRTAALECLAIVAYRQPITRPRSTPSAA